MGGPPLRSVQIPCLGTPRTPESLQIFLNGEHVFTYDKSANALEYPFNEPQNLIMNLAMGGGQAREIDPSLTAERLEVEYIRVYGRQ